MAKNSEFGQFILQGFAEEIGVEIIPLLIEMDAVVDEDVLAGKRLVIVKIEIVAIGRILYEFLDQSIDLFIALVGFLGIVAMALGAAKIHVDPRKIGKGVSDHALTKLPDLLDGITKGTIVTKA